MDGPIMSIGVFGCKGLEAAIRVTADERQLWAARVAQASCARSSGHRFADDFATVLTDTRTASHRSLRAHAAELTRRGINASRPGLGCCHMAIHVAKSGPAAQTTGRHYP